MDISSFSGSPAAIGQLSTAMSNAEVGNAVSVSVLKKAMDTQEQAATQLIQSVSGTSSAGLPEGVGGNINVTA
ncbi:YjfB family protein [Imhoffiella purpurea]|uniref:Motility protein n=1 Tax=Imhoffiella purpurea TaxID=1249627 RepID=W9V1I9_9GAMM|nr:YjfB family protein [Imhoffiella purpurea]EXJ13313.1 hypothetical protein D779_3904 [Imhoffiella purpurea]